MISFTSLHVVGIYVMLILKSFFSKNVYLDNLLIFTFVIRFLLFCLPELLKVKILYSTRTVYSCFVMLSIVAQSIVLSS